MHFYTDIHLQGTAAILNSSGTDILLTKQDTLVSGTNIKTINGISILGSGDISTSGGVGLTKFKEVEYLNPFNCATRTQLVLSSATCVTQTIADVLIEPKGNGSISILCASYSSLTTTRACSSIDFNFIAKVAGTPGNDYQSNFSVISGGSMNENSNSYMSVISGGGLNTNTSSDHSVISGGICNTSCFSACSYLGGGSTNGIGYSPKATIVGGTNHAIICAEGATVSGGYYNRIICNSACSTIVGGSSNCVARSPGTLVYGVCNNVHSQCYASILGGLLNNICTSVSFVQFNTILNGYMNNIVCTHASSILGGVSHNITNSNHSTILGGVCNSIQKSCAVMFGRCGQIGSNSNAIFAIGNGIDSITNTADDFNLIFSIDNDGRVNTNKLKIVDGSQSSGKVLMSDSNGVGCWCTLPSSSSISWGCVLGSISAQLDLQNCFNAKQGSLVSGTSIKTINGTSLLGSGDISIVAGGGGSSLCCTVTATSTPITLQMFCYNSNSSSTTNLWNCYYSVPGNMNVNTTILSGYTAKHTLNVCSTSATLGAYNILNVYNPSGSGVAINCTCISGKSVHNVVHLIASGSTSNSAYNKLNMEVGSGCGISGLAITQSSTNNTYTCINNDITLTGCSDSTVFNNTTLNNAYSCLGTYGNVCNKINLYASGNSVYDKFMCSDLSNTYNSTFMCGLRNSYSVCLGNHTSTTTSLVNCILFKTVNIGCNVAVNCNIVCNTSYPGQASVTSISIPNLTYSADSTLNSYAFANQLCARSTGILTANKNIGNVIVSTALVGTNALRAVNHICSNTASSTTCALVCIEAKSSTSASAEIHIDSIKVKLPSIPTSDPAIAGMIWNNNGVLSISAG